jgi:hypothetical protein
MRGSTAFRNAVFAAQTERVIHELVMIEPYFWTLVLTGVSGTFVAKTRVTWATNGVGRVESWDAGASELVVVRVDGEIPETSDTITDGTASGTINAFGSNYFTPIRLVNNTENVTSRTYVYTAFAFKQAVAKESIGTAPQGRAKFDNVSLEVLTTLQGLAIAPQVTVEVVLDNAPDVVELGPYFYRLREIDFDVLSFESTLRAEDLLTEPYPWARYLPWSHPGLY